MPVQAEEMPGRNLVVCIDGTCNSTTGASNLDRRSVVSRLLDMVEVSRQQLVAYDQGIGTSAATDRQMRALEVAGAKCVGAYWPLPIPPLTALTPSAPGLVRRWRGILFGLGLRENVLEIVKWLAEARASSNDRIFLFGFSRGAFTARAVAGLLQRCGLPTADKANDPIHLARCWELFDPPDPHNAVGEQTRLSREKQEEPDFTEEVAQFRSSTGQQAVSIHFLGLWDTVKSYGTIVPVLLPLLRHNPAVRTVRHAMALDERKGWFDATTWGGLDSDKRDGGPFSRLDECVIHRLGQQCIEEVWFQGGHSSLGSGEADDDLPNPNPALSWMLSEAILCGLRVNDEGVGCLVLHQTLGDTRPVQFKSDYLPLGLLDFFPRCTIDNGGIWPDRTCLWFRGAAPRDPAKSARSGKVRVHDTVTHLPRAVNPDSVIWVRTRSNDALAVLQGKRLAQ